MNRFSFWFALAMALLYVLVTVAEAYMYSSWDTTVVQERDLQAKMVRVQPIDTFAKQLVRRMILDSANDPTLTDLLKKHGLKVSYPPEDDQQKAPELSSTSPTPAAEPVKSPDSPVPPHP